MARMQVDGRHVQPRPTATIIIRPDGADLEHAQHRKPGGLQQKSRAERTRLGEAFEQRDVVAAVGKQRSCGLARDAAADDADPQSPPFTTRHWPLT